MQRAFLTSVGVAVFALAALAAHWRPLWFDEFFTLYVAQEPSVVDTVKALLAGADTNPPLDYLLRHLSFDAFGTSAEAFRWPSAAAFVAGMFAVYLYLRPRVPFLAAASAFLLPLCTRAVDYAYEGRAYALLFASGPIALLAWQRAVDRPRNAARVLALVAALCIGPFSHYFGVLSIAPVAAGEIYRSVSRRRVDWRIAGALAATGLLLLLLLPFARNAASMSGAFWASRFGVADVFHYFRVTLQHAEAPAAIVLVGFVVYAFRGKQFVRRPAPVNVPVHELVAAIVLALTPVSAYVLAKLLTGALTARYTIALVGGVAILTGYVLAKVCASARVVALASVALLTAFGLGYLVSAVAGFRGNEPVPAEIQKLLRQTSLPVAFDSPHLYLTYVHYEPDLARTRFWYPMDAQTALALHGFNNDEIALRGLSRIVPLQVANYADFVAANPEFLVLYGQDYWPSLVKMLQLDGYCLQAAGSAGQTILLHATRSADHQVPCRQE